MSNKRPRLDRDAEALLGDLMATPVGRRHRRRQPAMATNSATAATRSAAGNRRLPSPSPIQARSSSSRLAPPNWLPSDLKGNPVKYFGTDPNNLQYTQPLANPGTYLALAVDGGNHIYLLYYTNDGSQPGDYHLDVYNPNGTPLTTLSTGINVPKMAVDFWRSVYGVNFTPLNTPSGQVAVPSISRFDPNTPD